MTIANSCHRCKCWHDPDHLIVFRIITLCLDCIEEFPPTGRRTTMLYVRYWASCMLVALTFTPLAYAEETLKVNQAIQLDQALLCGTLEDLEAVATTQITDGWEASKVVLAQMKAEKKCLITPKLTVHVRESHTQFVDMEFPHGKVTGYAVSVIIPLPQGVGAGYTILTLPVEKKLSGHGA